MSKMYRIQDIDQNRYGQPDHMGPGERNASRQISQINEHGKRRRSLTPESSVGRDWPGESPTIARATEKGDPDFLNRSMQVPSAVDGCLWSSAALLATKDDCFRGSKEREKCKIA